MECYRTLMKNKEEAEYFYSAILDSWPAANSQFNLISCDNCNHVRTYNAKAGTKKKKKEQVQKELKQLRTENTALEEKNTEQKQELSVLQHACCDLLKRSN